jgi:hypothetical protein
VLGRGDLELIILDRKIADEWPLRFGKISATLAIDIAESDDEVVFSLEVAMSL